MNKSEKAEEKSPELISLMEVSKMLGCHPNTLRQWDEKGILKAVRIGPRQARKYKKSDIIKIVEGK